MGATSVESPPPITDAGSGPRLAPALALMAGTVVVFGLIAVARSHQVDVPFRDPHGKMFARKLLGAVWIFVVLSIADVAIRWWRAGRGAAAMRAVVRTRWAPSRLALVGAGLLAYHLVYICYRNLKSWLVFRPIHDDRMLQLDRDLFFGHSPATVLHHLLGTDHAAHPLSFFYAIFTYVCTAALVGCLAFLDDIRKAYVMVIAGMWTWILGTASYYLIPTMGPVFSVPQEFAMLPHTAVTDMVTGNIADRAQMLADPQAPGSFVGVAAFASLHVGFTTTVVLMMAYLRKRLLTWLAGLYLVPVVIATIYFGWHFLPDLAGGALLAAMSVLIAHVCVYRSLRRPA
ncbi:MAG: phosphatase PAP2 family protein [Nocardioides sp.]